MTINELHELTGVLIAQNMGNEPVWIGHDGTVTEAFDLKLYVTYSMPPVKGAIVISENADDLEPNCADIIT